MNATPRQAQAWEAVNRLGSQTAAAKELGIHQTAIQQLVQRYMDREGIPGPRPSKGYPRHGAGWPSGWHVGLDPTEKQRRAWEAIQRTEGNFAAAGRELGVTGSTIQAAVRGYLERLGEDPDKHPYFTDPPAGRTSLTKRDAQMVLARQEIVRLKRRVQELVVENERLFRRATNAKSIEDKIDRILSVVQGRRAYQ